VGAENLIAWSMGLTDMKIRQYVKDSDGVYGQYLPITDGANGGAEVGC
jgi:hypothetical protein